VGSISIPTIVTDDRGTNYVVTKVGDSAFFQNLSLTSVTIPDTVTSIGVQAFAGCLFKSFTIPDSVVSIEDFAFDECINLADIRFPDSVATIGASAFGDCVGLFDLRVGNGVLSIGDTAFSGCYGLTNVTLGPRVKFIGSSAFGNCTSLTNIVFPNSVTSISSLAFGGCSALSSACFEGNAPHNGGNLFLLDCVSAIRYVIGTTGWGALYDGKPTVACSECNPAGSLKVIITPTNAVSAGAQWTLDSSAWHNSGETLLNLPVGQYTIRFSYISGWNTPTNQSITITNGQLTTATNLYKPLTSSVQVTIYPQEVRTQAQWQVDGRSWSNSSVTVTNLSVGNHTVSFKAVKGWQTPPTVTTYCPADVTTPIVATYAPIGSLQVKVFPPAATNAGAQWRVDGGAWQKSGATVTNLVGALHTVDCGIVTGWTTPSDLIVTIKPSTLTATNAIYGSVTNRLQVSMAGKGTISPNYSNSWLEMGQNYSIKATAGLGFVFSNWAVSTNWTGSATTNSATVQFVMQSNLTLQVNFADVTKPTITITSPTAGQKMTNALANLNGTAFDNWGIGSVQYQLNGGAWGLATSTNAWTNWAAVLPLTAGTNVIKAYAVDLSGNASTTNIVSMVSSNTFNLHLGFGSAPPITSNGLQLSLEVSRGISGRLEVSTNLKDWTTLTGFISTNATMQFSDAATTNYMRRFYRAVVP
jgi:hypothetical protein